MFWRKSDALVEQNFPGDDTMVVLVILGWEIARKIGT
jgi:hypothetical protein